jgi:hypothetical protein
MKINASMTTVVIPGLVAGVIYFVIAFATGAPAVASIIGGIVVAAIAVAIGFIFRAVYKRRVAGPQRLGFHHDCVPAHPAHRGRVPAGTIRRSTCRWPIRSGDPGRRDPRRGSLARSSANRRV